MLNITNRRQNFRFRFAPVVKPRRRNVRVPQPLLNLGNVRGVIERIRRRRRSQAVNTDRPCLDAQLAGLFLDDVPVNRVSRERLFQHAKTWVFHRPELRHPQIFPRPKFSRHHVNIHLFMRLNPLEHSLNR